MALKASSRCFLRASGSASLYFLVPINFLTSEKTLRSSCDMTASLKGQDELNKNIKSVVIEKGKSRERENGRPIVDSGG